MQARRSKGWQPDTPFSVGAAFVALTLGLAAWYVFSNGSSLRLSDMRPAQPAPFLPVDHVSDTSHATSAMASAPSTALTPPQSDRLIVVAHYHEELSWVDNMTVPVKLIEKDNPLNPDNVDSNNMSESTSYLYYMIKYYDALPNVVAFVHGHGDPLLTEPQVWSVDSYTALPHPETLETCNTRHAQQRGAIVWLGGPEYQPNDTAPFLDDYSARKSDQPDQYQRAFHDLFAFLRQPWADGGLGMRVPDTLTTLCCSAFSVTREVLRAVPKEAYVRLFDYLETAGNRDMGVAMEYVWVLLFDAAAWS